MLGFLLHGRFSVLSPSFAGLESSDFDCEKTRYMYIKVIYRFHVSILVNSSAKKVNFFRSYEGYELIAQDIYNSDL